MIRLEGLSNDPGGKQRSFVWFGTLQCPFALHYEVSEGIAPPVPSWDERSSILPLFHFVAHFQRSPDRTVLRGTNVVANGLCHSKGTLLDCCVPARGMIFVTSVRLKADPLKGSGRKQSIEPCSKGSQLHMKHYIYIYTTERSSTKRAVLASAREDDMPCMLNALRSYVQIAALHVKRFAGPCRDACASRAKPRSDTS